MVKEINQLNEKSKILKTPAIDVEDFFDADVRKLIEDLLDTAREYETEAVGLAANQIWEKEDTPPYNIFVAKIPINREQEISGEEVWNVFINPKIHGTGKKIKMTETCMSKRNYKPSIVKRDKNATLTWQDENKNTYEMKFAGLLSIIVQHETDHLKGKLI
jgi:peptide deformylase